MFTKAQIFNFALSALLLQKQISDTENDPSPQAQVLRTNWDMAFTSALADMDLDGTASHVTLAKVEDYPNEHWNYAYLYPADCIHFRRVASSMLRDNRSSQIPKQVVIRNGKKVILTNHESPIAEYISKDIPLSTLNANAGMAIGYKLALLCSPLITGKGALALKKDLMASYLLAKGEAQEQDRLENSNFDNDEDISEFVEVRTS